MTSPDGATTLDELVTLVRTGLGAACVMITRVTDDKQTVLAHAGRSLPEWFGRSASLDYSICQHSVAMNFPLVIDDAISHPLLRGNRAVTELNVAAYIGVPIHAQPGKAMGALCAVEFHQRRWTEEDVTLITEAARKADSLMATLI